MHLLLPSTGMVMSRQLHAGRTARQAGQGTGQLLRLRSFANARALTHAGGSRSSGAGAAAAAPPPPHPPRAWRGCRRQRCCRPCSSSSREEQGQAGRLPGCTRRPACARPRALPATAARPTAAPVRRQRRRRRLAPRLRPGPAPRASSAEAAGVRGKGRAGRPCPRGFLRRQRQRERLHLCREQRGRHLRCRRGSRARRGHRQGTSAHSAPFGLIGRQSCEPSWQRGLDAKAWFTAVGMLLLHSLSLSVSLRCPSWAWPRHMPACKPAASAWLCRHAILVNFVIPPLYALHWLALLLVDDVRRGVHVHAGGYPAHGLLQEQASVAAMNALSANPCMRAHTHTHWCCRRSMTGGPSMTTHWVSIDCY